VWQVQQPHYVPAPCKWYVTYRPSSSEAVADSRSRCLSI